MKNKTFSQTRVEWHLCDVEINSRGKKICFWRFIIWILTLLTLKVAQLQFLFINNRQESEVHLNQEEKGQ